MRRRKRSRWTLSRKKVSVAASCSGEAENFLETHTVLSQLSPAYTW